MTEVTVRSYESIQDAAARTGVSQTTIRRYIHLGVFKVYRIGRLIRLDPLQVDLALDPSQAGHRS